MFTRIGLLALVLLLALAATPSSMADPASFSSRPTSSQSQDMYVQGDSSTPPFPNYNYGGICYGYNFECTAHAWSAEECCSSWVLCPNGEYVPPYEYYPYHGWEVLCF